MQRGVIVIYKYTEEDLVEMFKGFIKHNIIQRYNTFIELNKQAKKGGIVFVGDSITEGFPIHELLSSDNQMYNRGIGGDTTDGVIAKLKDVVFDLEPKQIFLLIGTNDLGSGKQAEQVIQNIAEICSKIKEKLPDAQLYVESIYPLNPSVSMQGPFNAVGQRTNEDIKQVNHFLQELASSKSIHYINLYDKLINEEGLLNSDYTYDGLHLNMKGYVVVKEELQLYI